MGRFSRYGANRIPILRFHDGRTICVEYGNFDMQRMKNTGSPGRPPRPAGNWLAGMVIGSAIMTIATQAMLFGATAAINSITLKDP
jgi:hypothetical protein